MTTELNTITSEDSNRFVAMKMIGDSMLPTIPPGASVVVDTSVARVTDAGIYAIVNSLDAIVLKLVELVDDIHVRIGNRNTAYSEPREVLAEDLRVAGRAVCVMQPV